MLPDGASASSRVPQRDCNWLQSLEGDIDTSHFGFLHVGAREAGGRRRPTPCIAGAWSIARRDYQSTETDWGTMYAAYRPADPGNYYYRFAHFMFPCFALVPNGYVRGT